jgi:hypothetical protein
VTSQQLGSVVLVLIDRMLSQQARKTLAWLFRREDIVLALRVRSRKLRSKESHQTKRSEDSFEGGK